MELLMKNILNALENLNKNLGEGTQRSLIPFEEFLKILLDNPESVIRNVFQTFYHMVHYYVGEGIQEYPDDPESVGFLDYECNKLFAEGADNPFFADRLFANRFMKHVESMRRGAQQNKIYIFEGPPGCGKSTFLNNLLSKFEKYTNTLEGTRYEVVWRLDKKRLGSFIEDKAIPLIDKITRSLESQTTDYGIENSNVCLMSDDCVEVPCPNHDNPLLIIPKRHRRAFLDDLFENDEFKWKLFTEKEFDWIFRYKPCTICSSLFKALLEKLSSSVNVFDMIYVRKYVSNRRLGEGISVFNPGDRPLKINVLSNQILQNRINDLLKDSNAVNYLYSRLAKTNSGIYALMDIKSYNKDRFIELHNIISEGVHRVEFLEENVESLFYALMNPEDKEILEGSQSFSDRIEFIKIAYVLDLKTEVEIYRNIFGKHIDSAFLPRVLHNFARVIISSRLNQRSAALLDWIATPEKYSKYCDANLHLLKMEIYTGYIPPWLSEEDRKSFNAERRRRVLAEAEKEGENGFSGRDSIKIFNDFYSRYARQDRMITMSNLVTYFTKTRTDLIDEIPEGFLDSLVAMYNYTILQEVKESLYYYNEEQIAKDIKNYIFAVNFDLGSTEECIYTKEKLEITEEFLQTIEFHLLGYRVSDSVRHSFRKNTQKEYTSRTLTQELMVQKLELTETKLYKMLHERYVHKLKENVLDPFLANENFRRAIKDYNTDDFKTYDKRIQADVTFLINNLMNKFSYTNKGAQEVCIYAIDNDLAKQYASQD